MLGSTGCALAAALSLVLSASCVGMAAWLRKGLFSCWSSAWLALARSASLDLGVVSLAWLLGLMRAKGFLAGTFFSVGVLEVSLSHDTYMRPCDGAQHFLDNLKSAGFRGPGHGGQ